MAVDELDNETNQLMAENDDETDEQKEVKQSIATQIRKLVFDNHVEFGYNDEKRAFARVKVNGHHEVYAIDSVAFHDYIYQLYDKTTQNVLPRNTFDAVTEYFGVYARTSGQNHNVVMRVGQLQGKIYLDLCNDRWEAVEITADGWQVISDSPVWFYRTNDMGALPYPDHDGSYQDLEQLKTCLNFAVKPNSSAIDLVVGWLLGSFLCDNARPILILQGTAGAGKSTASKIIRSIIDPAKRKELISRPRPKVDSLAIDAIHQHTLVYDNFSTGSITAEVSDMFCTIATNQSYSKRALYTNSDEVLVKLGRCVIINGIDDLAKRQDLLDRSIVLEMKAPAHRKPETELYEWFEQQHPLILGALLNTVSDSLKHHGESTYSNGRMVDWCRFVEDGHQSLNMTTTYFGDTYDRNRHKSVMDTIETNPFVSGIIELLGEDKSKRFTKSELVTKLRNLDSFDPFENRGAIPKANQVKARLARDQPLLKQAGIEYEESASRGKRYVEFIKK